MRLGAVVLCVGAVLFMFRVLAALIGELVRGPHRTQEWVRVNRIVPGRKGKLISMPTVHATRGDNTAGDQRIVLFS